MTNDTTPVPAAPTPRTPEQAAAIHGRNQLETYPDEATAPALDTALTAEACTYWHWNGDDPQPCARPAGHHAAATWAQMEHRDATGSTSGAWFSTGLPHTRVVAAAALTPDADIFQIGAAP